MENEINDLREFFINLYNMIVGKDENLKYTTEEIIRQIIYMLENCKKENFLECKAEIKRLYGRLYPMRGGLTEFFFWDNDYEKREEMNSKLDKLKKEISILMKKLFY